MSVVRILYAPLWHACEENVEIQTFHKNKKANNLFFTKLDFWAGRISSRHLLLVCFYSLINWVIKKSPHKNLKWIPSLIKVRLGNSIRFTVVTRRGFFWITEKRFIRSTAVHRNKKWDIPDQAVILQKGILCKVEMIVFCSAFLS